MTTSIQAHPAAIPQSHAYGYRAHRESNLSYNESRQSSISITTDEGDVVTLSVSNTESACLSSESSGNPLKESMNFTVASLEKNSFELSVQGDLSEQELADIGSLMEDLNSIAENFFSGNLDAAMSGALQIGDLGSLASLNATFSHSMAMSASQLNDFHPLPALDSGGELFADLSEELKANETEKIKYIDLMHARWDQMKDYLEASQENTVKPAENHIPAGEFSSAEKMMQKVAEFAGDNPSLAPFAPSLARKAIHEAADSFPSPQTLILRDQLNYDFMKEMNNWLFEI